MRVLVKNTGIQQALIAIILGTLLSYTGDVEVANTLLSAGSAYIVGKLQRRPSTVALDEALLNDSGE